MSLFNQLPDNSITCWHAFFCGTGSDFISLNELKDQLLLNPQITGAELLEQLERGRCLKDEHPA